MISATKIKRQLVLCRDDPMWDAHSEISKVTLSHTLLYIEKLERQSARQRSKIGRLQKESTRRLNANHRLEDTIRSLQREAHGG